MANEKSPLSWDRDMYYVEVLKSINITEDTMRKEYEKLRKSVQRRISRLRVAGYDVSGVESYFTRNLNLTAKKARKADLPYLLSDAARFLERRTSTVAGRREFIQESVNTLHSDGYSFVNVSNFEDFGWFMDAWHQSETESLYSSTQIAELYEFTIDKGLNVEEVKQNFKAFMDYKERNDNYVPPDKNKSNGWSSRRLREEMEK